MSLPLRTLLAAVPLVLAAACASPPPRAAAPGSFPREPMLPREAMLPREPMLPREQASIRVEAARTAYALVGAPYRYGGRSPAGFDCSGLVVYSFARAGLPGLPHSAAALEQRARPVALAELAPGDLLFFDLGGRKTAHVGIYLGEGAFVHAPSSGKRVERVGFEHAYWGARVRRAGRLPD